MPLNPVKVALAVQQGYSIVCATCTKFWENKDKGASNCAAKDGCRGPLGGGTFHEYEGPITEFETRCFVCGNSPNYVITGSRAFGVCKQHVHLVNQVAEVPMFLKSEGHVIAAESLIRKPIKNSVARFIMEVEEYYAKKEGREL